MRILGIDPGLRTTGFGVIEADGPRLRYVASGTVRTVTKKQADDMPQRGDLPARIRLTVAHPTRGGLDQEVLVAGAAGVYEAPLAPLGTGRWLFVLEDEARSWRMDGSAFLPAEMEITIDPNA